MNIDFEVQKSDTVKHLWTFYVNDTELILDTFQEMERQPGNRNWNITRRYCRVKWDKVRGYHQVKWNDVSERMTVDEVPWTVEIRNMARDKFIEQIDVKL